jgi:hypothetical protein
MVSSRRAQVFAGFVIHPRLTGALTVPLAIANKEINIILIPVIAVSHFVLTKEGCRLNEKIARFCSNGRFT